MHWMTHITFICSLFFASLALADTQPININHATVEEFSQLKGIGPAKARAIVEHRQHIGEFKSLEELTLVKGIGMATLEKNRDVLTLDNTEKTVEPPPRP